MLAEVVLQLDFGSLLATTCLISTALILAANFFHPYIQDCQELTTLVTMEMDYTLNSLVPEMRFLQRSGGLEDT